MRFLKIFMVMVFMGASITAIAQQSKSEQIRSMRVSVYTRVLQLTPPEAEKFWPIFNEYQAERDELRKEIKADRAKNIEGLSEKEAEALVDRHLQHEQRELELKRKYMAEFKKVIPMKKVALLPHAEREFKMELIDILRKYEKQGGKSTN